MKPNLVHYVWPEAVSDGIMPCGVCGRHTDIDYQVNDELWRQVPPNVRYGVVCIQCLIKLFGPGEVVRALKSVQLTLPHLTVELAPVAAWIHDSGPEGA